MFADTTAETASIATIAGLVGALTTAIPVLGAWVLNLLKARRDSTKQDRLDAIAEWQELVGVHQKEIAELKADNKAFSEKVFMLIQQEGKCQEQLADARVKLSQQDGQIQALTRDVRRLQILTRDSPPGVSVPCIVVATADDGIIRVASPSCGAMFGWLPEELVGQNITILMPPEMVDRHMEGLRTVAKGTKMVDQTKPLRVTAIKRDGTRFPVMIHLSQWATERGSIFVNAEIRDDVDPEAGMSGPLRNRRVTDKITDPTANS